MSSKGKDRAGDNSIKDKESGYTKTSVIELLDELISHMNTTRSVFRVMILSSFILAPLSLLLASVFIIHPFFMNRILFRFPEVADVFYWSFNYVPFDVVVCRIKRTEILFQLG